MWHSPLLLLSAAVSNTNTIVPEGINNATAAAKMQVLNEEGISSVVRHMYTVNKNDPFLSLSLRESYLNSMSTRQTTETAMGSSIPKPLRISSDASLLDTEDKKRLNDDVFYISWHM